MWVVSDCQWDAPQVSRQTPRQALFSSLTPDRTPRHWAAVQRLMISHLPKRDKVSLLLTFETVQKIRVK